MAKTHTVVSGDTLYSLGKKYGLTVDELKSINKLTSDTIKVGQVLTVSKTTHKVVSGDTLFSLAKKYETTVNELKLLNGLKSDTIKVGQILRLPEIYETQYFLQDVDNEVFKQLGYEITFTDGTVCKGTTNNDGCTEKMNVTSELEIKEVKIYAPIPSNCEQCMPYFAAQNTTDSYELSSHGFGFYGFTSFQKTGKNVRVLPIPRSLHNDEIVELQKVFGESLKYKEIKIFNGKKYPKQHDYTAMAPDGNVYFPKQIYRENYVIHGVDILHFFIHELVHVWQHQRRHSLKGGGAFIWSEAGYEKSTAQRFNLQKQVKKSDQAVAYQYFHIIHKRNHFSEFNMEQQAEMIADYFIKYEKGKHLSKLSSDEQAIVNKLATLLQDFINDPYNEDLLPDSNSVHKTVWDR